MDKNDLYNIMWKIDKKLIIIKNHKSISKKNKKVFEEFNRYMFSSPKVSDIRRLRVLEMLYIILVGTDDRWGRLSGFNKDFDKVTKKDIDDFLYELANIKYTLTTKRDYCVVLKQFYKWYEGNNKTYPEKVQHVSTSIPEHEKRLPNESDMLKPKDILKMIKVVRTWRDKTIIICLFEGGMRISELLTCTIGNLSFDKYGALLNVKGKKRPREVRVIHADYLKKYLDCEHPDPMNKEMPLFVNLYGSRKYQYMEYDAVRKMLRIAGRDAKINKPVNPHNFRKSMVSYLRDMGVHPYEIEDQGGWRRNSVTMQNYASPSKKRIAESLNMAYNGQEVKPKEEVISLKYKTCLVCGVQNNPEKIYCDKCSRPLDAKIIFNEDNKMSRIENTLKLILGVLSEKQVKELAEKSAKLQIAKRVDLKQ